MFLRLCQANELVQETAAKDNALYYINRAKSNAKHYSKHKDERCAFLCGNAGIYAVSAAISDLTKHSDQLLQDLKEFATGFEACKPVNFGKHGSDEMLVGRAGFLSGVYWLNQVLNPEPFDNDQIIEICKSVVESGKQYYIAKRSPLPLMYQYHGTEYLGAAHGLCGILQMLLESPWFTKRSDGSLVDISKEYLTDIKHSVDAFVALQDTEGNFPCDLQDARSDQPNILVHWCHGAPGAIYLLIKAYLVFQEEKYLYASERAADLVWRKGILKKGPGICHGVAGSGYAFLVMFRLTQDIKYLYRAHRMMEVLTTPFAKKMRQPDCPFSLYEGLAGTVCFLIDLMNPELAAFPFMNVF